MENQNTYFVFYNFFENFAL